MLITGLVLGLFLSTLSLWIFKVKCPECKQLKPLKEIVVFEVKKCEITGRKCWKCKNKKMVDIRL